MPDYSDATFTGLKTRFRIERCVLIGYPDQFPFLLHNRMPDTVFFWYQCSRPVLPPGLEGATPIPLTGKTQKFLENAGHRRIGPVIPHGIDSELYKPALKTQSLQPESGGPVICSVGANSTRKRFDLLLESFGFLLASEPDARLAIKTDSATKPGGFRLQQMAEELGVSSRTTVTEGELSDDEMAGFYRTADCYVHTAEWEGFGIPVIEAMACGIPVVTHEVQGPGEIVPYFDLLHSDSKTVDEDGVLLRRAEPSSIANCIKRLFGNRELTESIAALGRREAEETYDIRKVADRWEDVILNGFDR